MKLLILYRLLSCNSSVEDPVLFFNPQEYILGHYLPGDSFQGCLSGTYSFCLNCFNFPFEDHQR